MFTGIKKWWKIRKRKQLARSLRGHYIENVMVPVSWRLVYMTEATPKHRDLLDETYLQDLEQGLFGGVPDYIKKTYPDVKMSMEELNREAEQARTNE